MIKTLYLCEKGDVGKTLAEYLWPEGDYEKDRFFCSKGDVTISWLAGHILAQAEPEKYGKEYESWGSTCIPDKWILYAPKDKAAYLTNAKKLLSEAESVVHVGDPDREGQLLVDEVLIYCGYKGPVRRLRLQGRNNDLIARAFKEMDDNKNWHPLYESGLARAQSDWLVGMNLTRAYTTSARKVGYTKTIRIGRVKLPTLALVVNREREITNFKKKNYYELWGTFRKDGGSFTAKYVAPDDILDSEGRVLSEDALKPIRMKCDSQTAEVLEVKTETQTKNPPLPFSTAEIQTLANKMHGYSPKEVLEALEELYLKKLTTYPRSGCNYLPEGDFADAEKITHMLAEELDLPAAQAVDLSIKSRAWNDKKLDAHYAIIPTGEVPPSDLDNKLMTIYKMIATRYCLQFYKPFKTLKTSYVLGIDDMKFVGTGTTVLDKGYKNIASDRDEDTDDERKEENGSLPPLAKGDTAVSTNYEIKSLVTHPPKRFTEGTLLKAMEQIWRYVAPDNPYRAQLKESDGIGTPATRDTIISELLQNSGKGHNHDAYLKKEKNYLVPTDFGFFVVDNLPPALTIPDTSAERELQLNKIAKKEQSYDEYMDSFKKELLESISFAQNQQLPPPPEAAKHPCPFCKSGFLIRHERKDGGDPYYRCSNPDCKPSVDETPIYYSEANGEPAVIMCPECKDYPLKRFKVKATGRYFWGCPKCLDHAATKEDKKYYPDKDGLPDLDYVPSAPTTSGIECPVCHKGYLVRRIAKASGKPFWVCSERDCKDKDGKPVFYREDDKHMPILDPSQTPPPARPENAVECPLCHKGYLVRKLTKATGKPFWVCSEKDCKDPSGKTIFYTDRRKKPVIVICPDCKKQPLSKLHSKKSGKDFWLCTECSQHNDKPHYFPDKDGAPDLSPQPKKGTARTDKKTLSKK